MGAADLMVTETDDAETPDSKALVLEDAIEQVGIGSVQWMLLVIAGLSFCSDAAEITFLSFATETLRCQWGMTPEQETYIAQAVFAGMILGAPVWGCLADRVGRRVAFLLSSFMICFFGLGTALCQGVYSLLVVRALVGFGVAGLPVGFDILAEALPSSGRGKFLLYIEYFWTLGSIWVTLCAWLTLEKYGWRVFTVLAAIPPLISTVAGIFYLPESPLWLMEVGRNEDALEIVNGWAKQNRKPIQFTAFQPVSGLEHGNILQVCMRGLRTRAFLMAIVWFGFGTAYYGIVSLLPRIFDSMAKSTTTTTTAPPRLLESGCKTTFDFDNIAYSVIGEVLGVVFALCTIDTFGRSLTQACFYSLGAAAAMVLGFRSIDMNILTAAATVGRLAQMAASCSTWVHTPELFPTKVRAQAHAVLNTVSKIGAVFAQYLVSDSFSQTTCGIAMASISFAAGVAAFFLPDTAGKDLSAAGAEDVVSEDSECSEEGSESE